MKIFELFEPGPHGGKVDSNDHGDMFVTKTIGKREITFSARNDRNNWEIVFHEYDKASGKTTYEKTGSGDEVKVFTFVMNAMREFVKKKKPKRMNFTADMVDESRVGLYKRMIARFGDDYLVREFKLGMGSAKRQIQFELWDKKQMVGESLDSSYPYEMYDEMDALVAEFNAADGTTVEVKFDYWAKPEYWEISFNRDGRTDMTGQGDAQKILSTFYKIVQEFVKQKNPKFFGYAANSKDESRVGVYRRMFARLVRKTDYVEASKRLDQIDHPLITKWFPAKKARVGAGDQPLFVRRDMFL